MRKYFICPSVILVVILVGIILVTVAGCGDKSQSDRPNCRPIIRDSQNGDRPVGAVGMDSYSVGDDAGAGEASVSGPRQGSDAGDTAGGSDGVNRKRRPMEAPDPDTWYRDRDGDGYGDPKNSTEAVNCPSGYVANRSDCNDAKKEVNPGSAEICGDGIDNDCRDGDEPCSGVWYRDRDGDGYGNPNSSKKAARCPSGYVSDQTDCNDAQKDVNPGAAEICGDGIDNDCWDGDAPCPDTWYRDSDGDDYGDSKNSTEAITCPSGYVSDNSDCDDSDKRVNPGALEVCGDGIDNNCRGGDEPCPDTWYRDGDGDGYGDPDNSKESVSPPFGYVADGLDCDDTRKDVNPGAAEVCGDGIDNDCQGGDAPCPDTWYRDNDKDGYGDPDKSTEAVNCPSGYVADNTDCDDGRKDVNPGAAEICGDGLDNDCQKGDAPCTGTWYRDRDNDGYGNPDNSVESVKQPVGYIADNSDCDDSDKNVHPGAVEVCGDRIDNDCRGGDEACPDTWYRDRDGDGYGDRRTYKMSSSQPTGYVADKTDCNDFNPYINPGHVEVCLNNVDDDCNGSIDDDCHACDDADGDGYFSESGCGTGVDCDDSDPSINPEQVEICYNGMDDDCNGTVDDGCNISADYTNGLGMTFNLIHAGAFMMGSPAGEPGRNDDELQHQVTLTRDFYMQTTEVTQGQWRAVMKRNPASFGGKFGNNDGCNYPVETVSWYDVQDFIKVLNRKGQGVYRLPTEAEWEYAARAGIKGAYTSGAVQGVGNDCVYDANLEKMGWYCKNARETVHPVAQKSPNMWGLYDMHGNVWEWCADWFGNYASSPVINPGGPSSGLIRVFRGGSWDSPAVYCRSGRRCGYKPDYKDYNLGFRVICLKPGR